MKQNHGAGGVFIGEFLHVLFVSGFFGDLPGIGVDYFSSSESSLSSFVDVQVIR